MASSTEHSLQDVYNCGYTLEPLSCLNPDCAETSSGNVSYHDGVADAYCSVCGEWQEDFLDSSADAA
jgi:hypothetical protein